MAKATKINLGAEVAKRAAKKYPTYELDVELPDGTTESIVFRNLIHLTKAERKQHSNAAVDLQNEIQDALRRAKEADEESDEPDPALIEELEALDGTDLYVRMLKRQLVVLAEDGEAAERALDTLRDDQISAIHSIVSDGLAASGE